MSRLAPVNGANVPPRAGSQRVSYDRVSYEDGLRLFWQRDPRSPRWWLEFAKSSGGAFAARASSRARIVACPHSRAAFPATVLVPAVGCGTPPLGQPASVPFCSPQAATMRHAATAIAEM